MEQPSRRCGWLEACGGTGRYPVVGLLAARGAAARTAGWADALEAAGFLACTHADPAAARPLYVESLALYRELGDRPGMAGALLGLGMVATDAGEEVVARSALEECLALYRELGILRGAAWALDYLGKLALQRGAPSEARALLTEALQVRRQAGDRHGQAIDLRRLVEVERAEGTLEVAAKDESGRRWTEFAFRSLADLRNKLIKHTPSAAGTEK